jgi:hypothetical protein
MNLLVYTLLALYSIAFDQVRSFPTFTLAYANQCIQLLPVFMHHPPQSIDDPNVELPFKFAGGFGIDSRRIGVMFTLFAVTSTLFQFLLFPPLTRRFGVLRCLRISFLMYPVVFFIAPFVSLLPNHTSREVAMVGLLIFRGLAGTFAFPTSTIMITNSAASLRVLGTINGLATSTGAVGRAAGPAIGGNLFTYGVKNGYIIIPFWTLSAIAFLAFIPTLWLEEGGGFGDDPDSDSESVLSAAAPSIDESANIVPRGVETERAESEYGEPTNLLSHTSTRSSEAAVTDDEMDMSDQDLTSRHDHGRRESASSTGQVRSHSNGRQNRNARRRTSVPLGMGRGFRRLSSNLGSAGAIGTGGASYGGT